MKVNGEPAKPPEITLPHTVSDYLDVAAVFHDVQWKEEGRVHLQFAHEARKYNRLIQKGKSYVLEVVVTADDAKPAKFLLELTWDGTHGGLAARKASRLANPIRSRFRTNPRLIRLLRLLCSELFSVGHKLITR